MAAPSRTNVKSVAPPRTSAARSMTAASFRRRLRCSASSGRLSRGNSRPPLRVAPGGRPAVSPGPRTPAALRESSKGGPPSQKNLHAHFVAVLEFERLAQVLARDDFEHVVVVRAHGHHHAPLDATDLAPEEF